jgi:23S rRNA (guanosine2251-2'-O)-methyltransferase
MSDAARPSRPPRAPRPHGGHRPPPGGFRPRPKRERTAGDSLFLYGLHTVEAALRNPRRVPIRLLATRNALARLAERFEAGLPVEAEDASPAQLDRLLGSEAVHQGVALEVEPLPPLREADLAGARLVLALDQVTDPHNVGAILRSACALGVDAVITTARHSPAESGVLAKAASGALDLVPILQVRNLGDSLAALRDDGFTVVGLDSDAPAPLEAAVLGAPVCLVLGAEGKGLRQRTRDLCDVLARLDMPGPIHSLNVSNACVLALYVVRRAIGPGASEPPVAPPGPAR